MESDSMFMDCNSVMKTSILTKMSCKFNLISIKIPTNFAVQIDELILKYV